MTAPACYLAYRHANHRLQERYGVAISTYQYDDLCRQIAHQRLSPDHPAVLGCKRGRLILAWRVLGTPVKLVWDYTSELVITFLPMARGFFSEEQALRDGSFQRQQMRRRRAYRRQPKYRGER